MHNQAVPLFTAKLRLLPKRCIKIILAMLIIAQFTCLLWLSNERAYSESKLGSQIETLTQVVVQDKSGRVFVYDRNSPIVFISGTVRSGTTLMRAMLDTLPEVR